MAAKQPMFGEISFDRAADEIFKSMGKIKKTGQPEAYDELVKGMALLYRRELNKTDEVFDEEVMHIKVQQYVT